VRGEGKRRKGAGQPRLESQKAMSRGGIDVRDCKAGMLRGEKLLIALPGKTEIRKGTKTKNLEGGRAVTL